LCPYGDGVTCLLDDVAGNGRLLLMMKLYLDRGVKVDKSDGVATVAAAIFRPVPYKQFVRPWNRMLAGWRAPAFHATDFYTGAPPYFDRSTHAQKERFERDSRIVPQLIGQHAARLVAIGFRPDEFLSVASDAFKAEYGSSIHSIAVQLLLIINGWLAKESHYREGFACFMESGDDDSAEVEQTVKRMKMHPVAGPHLQVTSFTTIDKGNARGLEAADCLAWHWNKYYMDKMRLGKPDEARKDFVAMMRAAEDKTYTALITGEKLKFFLGLAPLPTKDVGA
jgi:hypothetical protein